MYRETLERCAVARETVAKGEDGNEIIVTEDFRNLFRDEASIRKMKEPLHGNGRLRVDPLMQQSLFDLAWFFDSSRVEEPPCWDPYALEKMRKPVVGFSHYRIRPATIPILFNLAWFHDDLLAGDLES